MEMHLVLISGHAKAYEIDILEGFLKLLVPSYFGSSPRHFWNINLVLYYLKKVYLSERFPKSMCSALQWFMLAPDSVYKPHYFTIWLGLYVSTRLAMCLPEACHRCLELGAAVASEWTANFTPHVVWLSFLSFFFLLSAYTSCQP